MSAPRHAAPVRPGLAGSGLAAGMALLLLLGPGAARADVSFREAITLSGPGAVAGGGMHENRVQLAGDRRREDVSVKKGDAWLELERSGLSARTMIALLDSGELLRVRPDEKEFIAETWEEAAARLARVARGGAKAIEFRDPVTSLDAPGQLQVIGGIECRRVIVETKGGLVPDPGKPPRPLVLRAELWVADSFPGRGEMATFRKKEIERLGRDPEVLRYRALAPERYGRALDELGRGLAQVDGIAIQSLITITSPLGGQEAGPEGGRAGSGSQDTEGGEPGTPPGAGAGLKQASAPTRLKMRTDLKGKYAPGAIPTAPDWALMSLVTELESKAVDASRFQPPADFRRLVPKSRRKTAVAEPVPTP